MPDANPSVQPLDGKTSIDDKMFFEPERMSYLCAADVAKQIKDTIASDVKDKDVVIAGTPFLVDLSNLNATKATLAGLASDFRSFAAPGGGREEAVAETVMPAAAMLLPGISSAVTGVLGLLSLFREDLEFKGIRTVVDPLAFELALAGFLKDAGARSVVVPDLLVPKSEGSELASGLTAVHQARMTAWQGAAPFVSDLARLEGELDRAARAGDQTNVDRIAAAMADIRRNLDPLTQALSQADRRLTDLEANLSRPEEKTGLTMLARLLRAEAIIAGDGKCFVHAAVVSSGGHHRISRSLLRTLFVGDGLTFKGGAVVRWALVSDKGEILKAGIKDAARNGRFSPGPGGSE